MKVCVSGVLLICSGLIGCASLDEANLVETGLPAPLEVDRSFLGAKGLRQALDQGEPAYSDETDNSPVS